MSQTFKISGGDISYTVAGQPAMTQTGKEKLSQDLGEAAQSPTDDVGFGFGISNLVGRVEDPGTVPSLLNQKITDGLNRITALQQQNQSLIRGDDELIDSVPSIQTGYAAPNNYTDFAFSFAVRTVAQATIQKRGSVG